MKDFVFVKNEDRCGRGDVFMVILVDSAPSHVGHRASVRTSYGAVNISHARFVTLFLVGNQLAPEDQRIIDRESKMHHDILQGNFKDHYRNMSYADLMGFRWVAAHCPQARYIMKTDDDTMFDPFQLVDIMAAKFSTLDSFMACVLVSTNSPVYRDPAHSKWFMSYAEFKARPEAVPGQGEVYDPYCIQSTFLLTPALAAAIDTLALTEHEGFSINDIYLTGVLVRRLGIELHTLAHYYTRRSAYWRRWVASNPTTLPRYVFAPFRGTETRIARRVMARLSELASQYAIPRSLHP